MGAVPPDARLQPEGILRINFDLFQFLVPTTVHRSIEFHVDARTREERRQAKAYSLGIDPECRKQATDIR
jgi:hypothetical protein